MLSCIILAAGKNSRLDTGKPKSLIEVNGITLLERHIRNFQLAGVQNFCVVTGHNPDPIRHLLPKLSEAYHVNIDMVHNERFDLENGFSISVTQDWVSQNKISSFFLTMGDHIFQEAFVNAFVQSFNSSTVIERLFLAVDRPSEKNRHIDVDDVTKVKADAQHFIEEIGKGISNFNYYDTGLFHMKAEVFHYLKACFSKGKYTISDMVSSLIKSHQAKILELSGYYWNDVDNPSDLQNTIDHLQSNRL